MQLSAEQESAIADVMNPAYDVVFLTGPAGSGKSTIIKEVRDRGNITVCATTGKAAMNIDGVTVDKLFGIAREGWKLFSPGYTDWSMNKIPPTILIDEASMIGEKMGNLIFDVAKSYKKRIVLVGDWGQAAPVKDEWAFGSRLFKDAKVVKLTECHRQSAGSYLDALNKVRIGCIDASVNSVFSSIVTPEMPDKTFPGICMFATNKRADSYNEICFREHLADTGHWGIRFTASVADLRSDDKQSKKPLQARDIDKAIDDSPFLHEGSLAIGAKVVCTRNDNDDNQFQNGTMGVVLDILFADGRWVSDVEKDFDDAEGIVSKVFVETFDGRRIEMSRMEIITTDAVGNAYLRLEGFPIRLGFSVTIHRSQGMTVDKAWADLDSLSHFPNGSRHGLAYVALSRTRTLDGLQLGSWDPAVIECDAVAKPWL